MQGYGVFSKGNIMVAWFQGYEKAIDYKCVQSESNLYDIQLTTVDSMHSFALELPVSSECAIKNSFETIREDFKTMKEAQAKNSALALEVAKSRNINKKAREALSRIAGEELSRIDGEAKPMTRAEWLSSNPLRRYMFNNKIGYSSMSIKTNKNISSNRLQRLALGFEEPMFTEYACLSMTMSIDRASLEKEWDIWFGATPENAFERGAE